MTISTRNRLLGAAFVSTLPVIATVFVSYPELARNALKALKAADQRAVGLIAFVATFVAKPSVSAVLAALPICCVFAAGAIVMIYYSFEKTQAPEVLFFALFALSFIGEAFRIAVPEAAMHEWPPAIVVYAARAITFARFFGVLSLFAAGIYANGIEFQKHGRVILAISIAALTVATGIPVDGLTYDTAFAPLIGYRFMIDFSELAIALIAALSFLVAAYAKSAREFYAASLGIFLVVIGRDFLIRGDSWLAVPIGSVLLIGGTWLFAVKIHRYYLWL